MRAALDRVGREVKSSLVVVEILWRDCVRVLFCSWWGHKWRRVFFKGRHSGHGFMLTCERCYELRVPYPTTFP